MALVENQRTDTALQLLQAQLQLANTHQKAEQLVDVFARLPRDIWSNPQIPILYLQTLCRARKPERILQWLSDKTLRPSWRLYQAWAQLRLGQHSQALEALKNIPSTEEMDWGLYYRVQGEAMFWLRHEDWQAVLEQSRPHLQGPALGRMLLDQGAFLLEKGRRAEARICWGEALAYLQCDPYYLAWAHNSLGYSLLNDQPQEADRHLQAAVRVSQKQAAKAFRCKALSGLAAFQREMGEWERALSSYQKAAKAPGDPDDTQLALWGWGHTLRLMGYLEEALGKLHQAYELNPAESWLLADIAAVQLALGNRKKAQENLTKAGLGGERSQVVRRIVEAEIGRLEGRTEQAIATLAGLEFDHLWVREELSCFPRLASFLNSSIARPQRYRIEVQAYGLLEVRVNLRPIDLNPTAKPGEILVFLILQGGSASLERLLDKIGDEQNKHARKALWEHIKALRESLGWGESIQSCPGGYRLDPKADWICLDEPEPLNSREFMEGHYSDWILERRPLVL